MSVFWPGPVFGKILTNKQGHLFDRRMIGRDIAEEWGAGTNRKGSDDLVACVARLGRDNQRENRDRSAHVTGARMAKSNGHEVCPM